RSHRTFVCPSRRRRDGRVVRGRDGADDGPRDPASHGLRPRGRRRGHRDGGPGATAPGNGGEEAPVTVAIILSVALLALAAWIRAAGTAVARVPRADALRDASDGVKGAQRVADLLDDREAITPAVGVVESGLLVMAAVLATVSISSGMDFGSAVVTGLLVGAVIFLFGDPLPRSLGRWSPRTIAYRSAPVLALAVKVGGWANELL